MNSRLCLAAVGASLLAVITGATAAQAAPAPSAVTHAAATTAAERQRILAMNCTMTGGASGGPWFLRFDEATGTGLLNSVNSFKYQFLPNVMYGPYFGTDAQNLYNSAQTR